MIQADSQLAAITGLLARLWLREVDLATLEAMGTSSFCKTYIELGGVIPVAVNQEIVEQLAHEYCQLLVGPQHQISPVQSVWRENQFQASTAGSMSRFFELIPGYNPPSNLLDHIGVQLDFLSQLLARSEQPETKDIIEHFGKTHLNWTGSFLNRVEQSTSSNFYRGLAVVTRELTRTIFFPANDVAT